MTHWLDAPVVSIVHNVSFNLEDGYQNDLSSSSSMISLIAQKDDNSIQFFPHSSTLVPVICQVHSSFPTLNLSENFFSLCTCDLCNVTLHSSSFLSFHQESCPLNCALPMPGTADGDVVSRCQVLGRAGSVHHGADQ